LTQTDILVDPN